MLISGLRCDAEPENVNSPYKYAIIGKILNVESKGDFDNYEISEVLFKNNETNEEYALEGNAYFFGSRDGRILEFFKNGKEQVPQYLEINDQLDNHYQHGPGKLGFEWFSSSSIDMNCAGGTTLFN